MLHEPANTDQSPDPAAGYKARLGLMLFMVYALLYGGFVAINLTLPALMEVSVVWGINLAVVYGFGLIITALALALVYDALCRSRERGN